MGNLSADIREVGIECIRVSSVPEIIEDAQDPVERVAFNPV